MATSARAIFAISLIVFRGCRVVEDNWSSLARKDAGALKFISSLASTATSTFQQQHHQLHKTLQMAAEQRKLLGELLFSLQSIVSSSRIILTISRAAHGRRIFLTRSPTLHHRPQNLPFIPHRHLSPRSLHQHQARPGTVSKSAFRTPQNRVRKRICGREEQMGIRIRLHARPTEIH